MSNLNHIAAKPLVKKENSLRLSRAWLGWWQLRQSRPLSALVFLTQVMTGDTWFGGALITTLTLLSHASSLVNGFSFSKNVYRRALATCPRCPGFESPLSHQELGDFRQTS